MIRNPKTFSFSASPDTDITDYRIDVRRADNGAEVGHLDVAVGTADGQIEPDGAGLVHLSTDGGSGLKALIERGVLNVECALFVRALAKARRTKSRRPKRSFLEPRRSPSMAHQAWRLADRSAACRTLGISPRSSVRRDEHAPATRADRDARGPQHV